MAEGTPLEDLRVLFLGERFSSHVLSRSWRAPGTICSPGQSALVSPHYDFSVSSGWKTSAPNLPNGPLPLRKVAQGRVRVARRFPKSFSSRYIFCCLSRLRSLRF
jgi:hypothetical protein